MNVHHSHFSFVGREVLAHIFPIKVTICIHDLFNGLVKAYNVVSLTKHVLHYNGHHSSQIIVQITNTRFTSHPPLQLFHVGFNEFDVAKLHTCM